VHKEMFLVFAYSIGSI